MRILPSPGRRAAIALASLALAIPALTACAETSPGGRTGAIKVVASTTQICDYVTQIVTGGNPSDSDSLALDRTGADGITTHLGPEGAKAGAGINLTCLLAPNASTHEHDITAAQAKALSEADLFLVSGVDLEHFLDDAVVSTGFKGTMVITSGVYGAADIDDLDAQKAKEKDLPYTVERGSQKVDAAPWPFAPEESESEAEFRFDPHVWTSPAGAMIQVRNIGEALAMASPAGAAIINERTEAYVSLLTELDAWARSSFETVPADKRVLFTSHDAFGYLSKAYGLRFEGAALSDFNAQQDATAQQIQSTADAVRASGAVAIFAENSNNPASVRKVAQIAGVKAIIGDEALYGDSLGEPGSDGETYIGSILHNITVLTNAWGGTVAPIPASLAAWTPKAVAQ
ncbi:metal ABC transporter solute-binding protein, Zn/Mn family [Actinomyces gaoshouyii]|uniref:metal ABC transporter solute-binding protein, Zn/Mn family n=1 Tax=Actinomyces gaoshouyii TaxID=1960083 RepID=UPI0009BF5F7A|nr:zinc ABC transporter substrate-binding protein [Actinomyces gaoshouyii]ARD42034.1 zinc ABC transporter substrate-binding protein [Actinomyces gaoshouyii]